MLKPISKSGVCLSLTVLFSFCALSFLMSFTFQMFDQRSRVAGTSGERERRGGCTGEECKNKKNREAASGIVTAFTIDVKKMKNSVCPKVTATGWRNVGVWVWLQISSRNNYNYNDESVARFVRNKLQLQSQFPSPQKYDMYICLEE